MIYFLYDKMIDDVPICNFIPKEKTVSLKSLDQLEHYHKSSVINLLKSKKILLEVLTYKPSAIDKNKFYVIEPYWLSLYSKYWLDISLGLDKDKFFLEQTNLIDINTKILFWFVKEPFFNERSAIVNAMQRFYLHNNMILINCNVKKEGVADVVKNIKVIGFDYWWLYVSQKILPTLTLEKKEKYSYTFYNRKLCLSRSVIYFDLMQGNLLQNAKHHYHAFINDQKYYTEDEIKNKINEEIKKEDLNNLKNSKDFTYIINNCQWYSWIYKSWSDSFNNFFPCTDRFISDFSLHDDSYLDLITETYDWMINSEILCVSEKTYRSIANGCIFLILGGKGTLAHLKKHGIKTFDDIFDESYDDLDHWFDRWKVIEKNLKIWVNLGVDGRRGYYKKSFFKLVQNQRILRSRDFKTEIEDLLKL